MNEPTKEEMLLAMDLLFDPESPATPMFYAIRRLIMAVGEWQNELKEITDAFVAGEVSQSLFEAYLIERAGALRDFGKEEK